MATKEVIHYIKAEPDQYREMQSQWDTQVRDGDVTAEEIRAYQFKTGKKPDEIRADLLRLFSGQKGLADQAVQTLTHPDRRFTFAYFGGVQKMPEGRLGLNNDPYDHPQPAYLLEETNIEIAIDEGVELRPEIDQATYQDESGITRNVTRLSFTTRVGRETVFIPQDSKEHTVQIGRPSSAGPVLYATVHISKEGKAVIKQAPVQPVKGPDQPTPFFDWPVPLITVNKSDDLNFFDRVNQNQDHTLSSREIADYVRSGRGSWREVETHLRSALAERPDVARELMSGARSSGPEARVIYFANLEYFGSADKAIFTDSDTIHPPSVLPFGCASAIGIETGVQFHPYRVAQPQIVTLKLHEKVQYATLLTFKTSQGQFKRAIALNDAASVTIYRGNKEALTTFMKSEDRSTAWKDLKLSPVASLSLGERTYKARYGNLNPIELSQILDPHPKRVIGANFSLKDVASWSDETTFVARQGDQNYLYSVGRASAADQEGSQKVDLREKARERALVQIAQLIDSKIESLEEERTKDGKTEMSYALSIESQAVLHGLSVTPSPFVVDGISYVLASVPY